MKPIIKTIILLSISTFAVIVGIILIVIFSRIMKKTNDAKRREIRQKHRDEMNRLLQEEIIGQQMEKRSIRDIEKKQQTTAPPQQVAKKEEKKVIPEKKIPNEITKRKKKMVKDRKHNSEKPYLKNVELVTDRDFDILVESLGLKNLIKPEQLSNIKNQNPKTLIEFLGLVRKEFEKTVSGNPSPQVQDNEENKVEENESQALRTQQERQLLEQIQGIFNTQAPFIQMGTIFITPSESHLRPREIYDIDEEDDPKLVKLEDKTPLSVETQSSVITELQSASEQTSLLESNTMRKPPLPPRDDEVIHTTIENDEPVVKLSNENEVSS